MMTGEVEEVRTYHKHVKRRMYINKITILERLLILNKVVFLSLKGYCDERFQIYLVHTLREGGGCEFWTSHFSFLKLRCTFIFRRKHPHESLKWLRGRFSNDFLHFHFSCFSALGKSRNPYFFSYFPTFFIKTVLKERWISWKD